MIISASVQLDGVYTEDLFITNFATVTLTGMLTGNVFVANGSTLILHGILNGKLTVDSDSLAELWGTFVGGILSTGVISIHGIVTTPAPIPGEVKIAKSAIINGVTY